MQKTVLLFLGWILAGVCVAADPAEDGNLLVTTMTSNQLVKVSPTGTILNTTQLPMPVWACAVGDDGFVHCVLWRPVNWDQPPAPPS